MVKLKLENITAGYGELDIAHNIDISFGKDHRTCGVIGPNGAGKTTLLKSIVGMSDVKSGAIIFDEKNIEDKSPEEIAKLGITFVPSEEGVFPPLSVGENLSVPLEAKGIEDKEKKKQKMFDLFPKLKERINQEAGTLSGGERKMLSISMGLVTSPEVLLLDEISMGVMPTLVDNLYEALEKIDIPILASEQSQRILEVSDYLYLMEGGEIILEGPPDRIKDKEIFKTYMGL